jgi:hypothetical protein
MGNGLNKLAAEDPSFHYSRDEVRLPTGISQCAYVLCSIAVIASPQMRMFVTLQASRPRRAKELRGWTHTPGVITCGQSSISDSGLTYNADVQQFTHRLRQMSEH